MFSIGLKPNILCKKVQTITGLPIKFQIKCCFFVFLHDNIKNDCEFWAKKLNGDQTPAFHKHFKVGIKWCGQIFSAGQKGYNSDLSFLSNSLISLHKITKTLKGH